MVGATVESNGSWLCRRLAEEGIAVLRRTIVGDDDEAIRAAVGDALERTGTVLCTGGLGPTQDDLTRPAVAALYGWPLVLDDDWLGILRERFRARGRDMPETNRVQAEVPRGGRLLPNAVGTAPGLVLDDGQRGLTILLPGVPHELQWLTETHVIGLLRERLGTTRAPILHHVIRTAGLPESEVAARLADMIDAIRPLTIAFLPVGIGIDLRLTSWGDASAAQTAATFGAAEQQIRARLGAHVYGTGADDLAALVGRLLVERGLRIAVAESCTGGLVAKRLTDAAGASAWLTAGVVAYANEAKEALLGVNHELLELHGAVSEPAVSALLDGILEKAGVRCAIAVTGVAGPGGGSAEKPVGTVWIGTVLDDRRTIRKYAIPGGRTEIRARAAQAALKQLFDKLNGYD